MLLSQGSTVGRYVASGAINAEPVEDVYMVPKGSANADLKADENVSRPVFISDAFSGLEIAFSGNGDAAGRLVRLSQFCGSEAEHMALPSLRGS